MTLIAYRLEGFRPKRIPITYSWGGEAMELVKKVDETYSIVRLPGTKCEGVLVRNKYIKQVKESRINNG